MTRRARRPSPTVRVFGKCFVKLVSDGLTKLMVCETLYSAGREFGATSFDDPDPETPAFSFPVVIATCGVGTKAGSPLRRLRRHLPQRGRQGKCVRSGQVGTRTKTGRRGRRPLRFHELYAGTPGRSGCESDDTPLRGYTSSPPAAALPGVPTKTNGAPAKAQLLWGKGGAPRKAKPCEERGEQKAAATPRGSHGTLG